MRLSIRSKLTFLLLFLLLLALVPVAWKGMTFFYADKETSLQDLNAQTVAVQAREIRRRLQSQQRWLGVLAAGSGSQNTKTLLEGTFEAHAWAGTFRKQGKALALTHVFYPKKKIKAESPKVVRTDKDLLEKVDTMDPGTIRFFRRSEPIGSSSVLFVTRLSKSLFGMALGPPDSVIDLRTATKAYSVMLVDGAGQLILHSEIRRPRADVSLESLPIVNLLQSASSRIAGGTANYLDPISEKEVMGAFAALGVANAGLVVQIPKEAAFAAAKSLMKRFAIALIVVFGIAVVTGLAFAHSLTSPIRKVAQMSARIAKGDFRIKIDHKSNDELGDLTGAFNRMGHELEERERKLEHAQKQLVQSEKMSAFGQMSAGIAHEVKNPLAGILGYAQLAKRKAGENEGQKKYLEIIEKETKRCKDIVENLMRFARQEKVEYADFDVNQMVKDSVALVDHQVTISGCKIDNQFAPDGTLPVVNGSANQIQQVLTNLMLNAQQAMKDKGTLTVKTQQGENGFAEIVIADTGEGIKPENLEKIFEPFFTTKPAGQGTGLGLAVTYGIIRDHQGDIKVESEVGVGTTFTVRLPGNKG